MRLRLAYLDNKTIFVPADLPPSGQFILANAAVTPQHQDVIEIDSNRDYNTVVLAVLPEVFAISISNPEPAGDDPRRLLTLTHPYRSTVWHEDPRRLLTLTHLHRFTVWQTAGDAEGDDPEGDDRTTLDITPEGWIVTRDRLQYSLIPLHELYMAATLFCKAATADDDTLQMIVGVTHLRHLAHAAHANRNNYPDPLTVYITTV